MSEKIEMNINADLKRSIQSFKTAMNKKYGKDEPVFAENFNMQFPSIPSGSATLDSLIGNGGWALGRVHEVSGSTGCGKSSLLTLTCANARRAYPDRFILYIDAEQAQNFKRMKEYGLDCENDDGIVFVQSQSAEQVFDIIDNAIATGGFSLIVLDSIPALMTARELAGDYDKETMAEKARFLSKSIPKLLEPLKKAKTALIFVNQLRAKMDMWGGSTTVGGNAIPYYSSTRVKLNSTPSMQLKENERVVGQMINFTVIKNKVGNPFGTADSEFMFGKGFDPVKELVDAAILLKLIQQGGAWFTIYNSEDKVQGRNGCYAYYAEHPDKLDELKNAVNGDAENFDRANIKDENGYE